MPPTTVVLLKERLDEAEIQRVDTHLRWIAADVDFTAGTAVAGDEGAWAVSGFFPPVLGITRQALRTYNPSIMVSIGDMSEHNEEEEAPQYVQAIGYYPQACLICDASTSEEHGHRLLGYVVLHLAERLDGYIQLSDIHIPAGPGYLFHINYSWDGQTRRHYTVVDAEYFRSFLEADHIYLGT
jgi:hypothetical protein